MIIKYETHNEIMNAFWDANEALQHERGLFKSHNEYSALCRTAFSFFIDSLHRDGAITDKQVEEITIE